MDKASVSACVSAIDQQLRRTFIIKKPFFIQFNIPLLCRKNKKELILIAVRYRKIV
jgi:hypothetical protein